MLGRNTKTEIARIASTAKPALISQRRGRALRECWAFDLRALPQDRPDDRDDRCGSGGLGLLS